MDKEVRKLFWGQCTECLGRVSLKRRKWLKGLLCPILWFQLQFFWGVLPFTSSMLLSGPHLSLLFCLRTYLQVGPEVQEWVLLEPPFQLMEGYREYRPASHPAGGKLRSTFYIHGSVELPQQHWALLLTMGTSALTHLWSPSLLSLAHFSSSLNPATWASHQSTIRT